MVRPIVAFALSVSASFTLALPAIAEPARDQNSESEAPETAGELTRTYLPRRLESPDTRVTSCDVCTGLTCTTLSVRGPCTVDKALDALREQEGGPGKLQQSHRARSVTSADFKPLAMDALPEVGRAEAGPEHRPQDSAAAGSRFLDVYENSNLPVSVRESNSLSVKAQSFRPLVLSDDAQDGGEDEDGKDEESSR